MSERDSRLIPAYGCPLHPPSGLSRRTFLRGFAAAAAMGIPVVFLPFSELNDAWAAADKSEAEAVAGQSLPDPDPLGKQAGSLGPLSSPGRLLDDFA